MVVVSRNLFTRYLENVHRRGNCLSPFSCERGEFGRGIEPRNRRYFRGVVGEVEAAADADLQNIPRCPRYVLLP